MTPALPLLALALVTAAPPTSERRPRERSRIAELAARFADDLECEPAIAALAPTSETNAWALLVACIQQDKFRTLKTLLGPPWRERLAKMPQEHQVRLVAHVLATSGGWFGDATPLLERNNIPIHTLGAVMDTPEAAKPSTYVVFRGKLESRRLLPGGMLKLVIKERGRQSVDTIGYRRRTDSRGRTRGYEIGKVGSRDAWEDTGRTVEATIDDLPILIRESNEYVFLGALRSVEENGLVAQVRIVDVFKPGIQLLTMGR